MQTKAVVISVDGSYATVETERTSACDGCHKAEEGGCSVCSLMGAGRKISAVAQNSVGANVGDVVLIESATGRMLWYAALVFILPLVIGLISGMVSTLFTEDLLLQIGIGAVGFIVCFVGIFIYSLHVKKDRCDIEVVEIVTKAGAN
ncbi:MAG: SoxR reducing system RseC family protein [Clostridia bacterium]|nr:SoxR reducing system RseC family protein [Clostridia bacterium]